jgi:hypothetical protein
MQTQRANGQPAVGVPTGSMIRRPAVYAAVHGHAQAIVVAGQRRAVATR